MKGLFIPDITAEMFRNGCLESIETLMAEGEVYDIEYDPKSEEPETKWISCKERLPEVWDYVLCSQINGDVGEGKLLDDGCWHICYDQSYRRKTWVEAWQPLPEKFKEEGAEE